MQRRRAGGETPYAYGAPGPAPGVYDPGAGARNAPGLMPFEDARERKRRGGPAAAVVKRTNPWYVVLVVLVMFLWLARYSRKEVVSKRAVRRHRDGLEGDLRDARARMTTLENDLFKKNKDYEQVVRLVDGMRSELETAKHAAEAAKLEAEKAANEIAQRKANTHEDGCKKELENLKKEAELARHKCRVTELELERAKHEAMFNKQHIKEELIKEDIADLDKALKEDIAELKAEAEAEAKATSSTA